MKKTLAYLSAITLLMSVLSCMEDNQSPVPNLSLATSAQSANNNMKGRDSARPVYYDDELFTVNMMELSDKAGESIVDHNASLNEIYAYNDLEDPQDFLSVIDAVPGEAFNPLWLQFLIVFNPGFTPHQFTSEEDVEEAAEGPNPEITLVNTGEVYRCSVIGPM